MIKQNVQISISVVPFPTSQKVMSVTQSYLLENQPQAHSSTILETLQSWSEQESDVQLVSQEGEKIHTHRIFLKLYSHLLNNALQDFPSDSVPSIFIPASTASLMNLIKILSTGVSLSEQKEDLVDVVNTAEVMGIYLEGIQIGEKDVPTESNDEFIEDSVEEEENDEVEKNIEKNHESVKKAENIEIKREKHDISSVTNESNSEFDKSLALEKDLIFADDLVEEPRASRQPVSCYECLKTFANKDKLRRHAVIHTGEKPFTCDECDSSFTRKDKLTQHKNVKHNADYVKVGHQCYVCNKNHGSKWHLNRHMQRAHSYEVLIQE